MADAPIGAEWFDAFSIRNTNCEEVPEGWMTVQCLKQACRRGHGRLLRQSKPARFVEEFMIRTGKVIKRVTLHARQVRMRCLYVCSSFTLLVGLKAVSSSRN